MIWKMHSIILFDIRINIHFWFKQLFNIWLTSFQVHNFLSKILSLVFEHLKISDQYITRVLSMKVLRVNYLRSQKRSLISHFAAIRSRTKSHANMKYFWLMKLGRRGRCANSLLSFHLCNVEWRRSPRRRAHSEAEPQRLVNLATQR